MNLAVTSTGDRSASDALGLWEPKRTLTLEAARKHSARIKVLRYILLTLCAALAAYLIYEFATQSKNVIVEDNPTESVKMVILGIVAEQKMACHFISPQIPRLVH